MEDSYLGPKDVYRVEIGIYDLWKYAKAKDRYYRMAKNHQKFIRRLYENIVPATTYFDDLQGKIYPLKIETEDVALSIINKKELYARKMESTRRRANMFHRAMLQLDFMEKEVIRIRYMAEKDTTAMTAAEFYTALQRAEEKLIHHLSAEKQQEKDLIMKADRDALRTKIHAVEVKPQKKLLIQF